MPTPTVVQWMPSNPFGFTRHTLAWVAATPVNPFLHLKRANIWNKVLPVDRTILTQGQLYPRGQE